MKSVKVKGRTGGVWRDVVKERKESKKKKRVNGGSQRYLCEKRRRIEREHGSVKLTITAAEGLSLCTDRKDVEKKNSTPKSKQVND